MTRLLEDGLIYYTWGFSIMLIADFFLTGSMQSYLYHYAGFNFDDRIREARIEEHYCSVS